MSYFDPFMAPIVYTPAACYAPTTITENLPRAHRPRRKRKLTLTPETYRLLKQYLVLKQESDLIKLQLDKD